MWSLSLLNCLFRRRSKKTSKLRITGLREGNLPVTGEYPAQMASNEENVSTWWRRHDDRNILYKVRTLFLCSSSVSFNIRIWTTPNEQSPLQWRHNERDGVLYFKSPASRLFVQSFVQVHIKENIKAPRHWLWWGESPGGRWIPLTKGQWRRKCFHLMTSSWHDLIFVWLENDKRWVNDESYNRCPFAFVGM